MRRSLVLILLAPAVRADASQSRDGIHRIDKRPQTTRPSRLHARDAGNVCGADMKLCPSSLGGSCCPGSYECGRESCYATTKGPSTCGTKVGWYACAAVYGAGCCPDGYLCQRAAHCVPPAGSSYSFDCPASQHLCPSSMNYGCCPNGMGCAADRCYSTSMVPVATAIVTTTADDGRVIDVTMAATAVVSLPTPTTLPDTDGQDQNVLKYYPAAVPKIPPQGGPDAGRGGISAEQLGGIVAGCASFAGLGLLVALLIWRRLRSNGGTAEEEPQRPEVSMVEGPTGGRGAEPLGEHPIVMTTPASPVRQSPSRDQPASGLGATDLASTGHRPTTPDERGRPHQAGCCDQASMLSPATYSEQQGVPTSAVSPYESSPVYSRRGRPMSDPFDVSSSVDAGSVRRRAPAYLAELEDQHGIAELPDSPCSATSGAADDWSGSGINMFGWVTRQPPPAYSPQLMTRIDGWANNVAASRLCVVDEEKNSPP